MSENLCNETHAVLTQLPQRSPSANEVTCSEYYSLVLKEDDNELRALARPGKNETMY